MERAFKREIALLESVFEFVSSFADRHDLDETAVFELDLAIEELFVNMVKYNPANSNRITVNLQMDPDRIIATVKDRGSVPFDPTKSRPYDTTTSLQERVPGGLGLHLVRSVMDDISYEYTDGESVVTLTKLLGKQHV